MKTSCIPHQKRQQLVIVREDYLEICNGDHAAAAILNIFEQWTNSKLDNAEQAEIDNDISTREGLTANQDTSLWIYKSQPELHKELLGLFGERKIADALKVLKDLKLLDVRTNPKFKWDRTLQYALNIENVLNALQNCDIASRKNAASKKQNDGMTSRKNAAAIPKTTTETISKREENAAPNPTQSKPNSAPNPSSASPLSPDESYRPNIFALYESTIGTIKPILVDTLKMYAAECPEDWVRDAFMEAANHNARNWAYVKAVLDRWKDEGRVNRKSTPKPAAPPKYYEPEPQNAALTPEEMAAIKKEIQHG